MFGSQRSTWLPYRKVKKQPSALNTYACIQNTLFSNYGNQTNNISPQPQNSALDAWHPIRVVFHFKRWIGPGLQHLETRQGKHMFEPGSRPFPGKRQSNELLTTSLIVLAVAEIWDLLIHVPRSRTLWSDTEDISLKLAHTVIKKLKKTNRLRCTYYSHRGHQRHRSEWACETLFRVWFGWSETITDSICIPTREARTL